MSASNIWCDRWTCGNAMHPCRNLRTFKTGALYPIKACTHGIGLNNSACEHVALHRHHGMHRITLRQPHVMARWSLLHWVRYVGQVAIRDMRVDMGVPAGGRSWTVEERDTLLEEASALLAEAGFFPPGSMDVPLLAEMIVLGDSGCFLDKVRRRPTPRRKAILFHT